MISKFLSRYWSSKAIGVWAVLGLVLSLSWGMAIPPVGAQDVVTDEIAYLEQSEEQWIEINLSTRYLTAWEGGVQVYSAYIASGTDDDPTYEGVFAIQSMYDTALMEGKAADGTPYEVADVPFVLYYSGSYAIHGAYWHDAFGEFITHGCVNVSVPQAQWLYDWAYVGTPVVIHW